jgi:hypothetical protein
MILVTVYAFLHIMQKCIECNQILSFNFIESNEKNKDKDSIFSTIGPRVEKRYIRKKADKKRKPNLFSELIIIEITPVHSKI